jgi:hypothetical protein
MVEGKKKEIFCGERLTTEEALWFVFLNHKEKSRFELVKLS